MKKRYKYLIVGFGVILVFSLSMIYLYLFHGFHDNQLFTGDADHDRMINQFDADADGDGIANLKDHDANNNGRSNMQDIVSGAKRLTGVLYDPLKGGHGNIGGRMGFIVCIDVPRIAYADAGIYLDQLMKDDYERHPDHYQTQKGTNTPATPYFYRRVRNVYDYAKANKMLIRKAGTPKVGDIVFYSRYHATLVVGVHSDGTYDEVEAHPKLIFVQEHKHKKWRPKDVARLLKQ
ncbi:DUF1287 domain-containing protein [Sporolactobacillus laevolacticus]|uniref:DUF1287 domain-containing protein n=1 Tax=Sporolactobacillus laevolacticus DSM 442 TaxID=1395513 RepID=V6J452_9BACL|nr:DUF1287 domain-containing protein [Sporolactobacillus laevolacticus]EST11499.1 hypothetical protein P343_11795 [Sporolactobacillus laevolacticus DSM 442]